MATRVYPQEQPYELSASQSQLLRAVERAHWRAILRDEDELFEPSEEDPQQW